ncbi:MAG TPA: hypothetical protein PL051_04770 [Candidatus Saccharibacteria bacterium]|nr:hypothetical protein [Candidatus Saccharibacteria bacterium]
MLFRRLVVLVVATFAMAGTSFSSPASADGGDQTNPQVVYLTKKEPGTNVLCPKGQDKMFIVRATVRKGERIKSFGAFSLRLKSGRDRYDDGSRVSRRLVEYYFAVGRKARVESDLSASFVYLELTEGAHPKATVEKQCFSRVP